MSQKRWDIEVLFLTSRLTMSGPIWYKGPVIRIGRNPGPGEMILRSSQGVAELHATIQVYEGSTVMLSAIEPYEVRVATHEHVEWRHVYPITESVKLAEGSVIHLGPLERGCRFRFLQSRSFDWQQETLGAIVDQSEDEYIRNQFNGPKRVQSNVPRWVVPTFLGSTVIFFAAIIVMVIGPGHKPPISITFQDEEPLIEYYNTGEERQIEASVLEGFEAPFEDFIMRYNAEVADMDEIKSDPLKWDDRFYKQMVGVIQYAGAHRQTYAHYERGFNDYITVINALREANMPEVFAAIPIVETRYQKYAVSPVCAGGIWQFMPEVATRVDLTVRNCKLRGIKKSYTPTLSAPPSASKRVYMSIKKTTEGKKYSCLIKDCEVDDRVDVANSTRGAIELLGEAWNDEELQASGSIVQMTIVAHNVGHDDSQHGIKGRRTNVLPAYRLYRKKSKKTHGAHFYGDNITCVGLDPHKADHYSTTCGGYLPNQGQSYGFNVAAQFFLSVCYYAKNYGYEDIFSDWEGYLNGYCQKVMIPTKEELSK